MESLLLKAEEAARLLQLSRSKVYAMLKDGDLPSIRIGRSVRISQEALRAWVTDRSGGWSAATEATRPTPAVVDVKAMFRKAGFEKLGLQFSAEAVTPALRRLADGLRGADPLVRDVAQQEAVRRLTKAGVRKAKAFVAMAMNAEATPGAIGLPSMKRK